MPDNTRIPDRILVAIGGNATHPEDISGTYEEQVDIAMKTAEALLPLALMDNELVVTHGNGPVVGKILMRQALTRDRIAPMPMDICVAHSQGGIAYLLVQALENALRESESERQVACLLTQVEVDINDSAFDHPSKPIGPFFEKAESDALGAELGWAMIEDSGRGWRHVVPSPQPLHICEISQIQMLARQGTVVFAGGGGGIPVVKGPKGLRKGIAAVIDKDLTSAQMANELGIETLLILTAIPKVIKGFGTAAQRELDTVTLSEIRELMTQGHFPPGSMGPKIEAAIRFLEGGGKRVVIGPLGDAAAMLCGDVGTRIVHDETTGR